MNQLSKVRNSAGESARDLPSPDGDDTQDLNLVDWTENLLAWAKGQLADWDEQARVTMRRHPVLSLIGAFTFGSLAGRLASRR